MPTRAERARDRNKYRVVLVLTIETDDDGHIIGGDFLEGTSAGYLKNVNHAVSQREVSENLDPKGTLDAKLELRVRHALLPELTSVRLLVEAHRVMPIALGRAGDPETETSSPEE